MKWKNFYYLMILFMMALTIACSQENGTYDKESWMEAFKKQEVSKSKPEKITEFKEIYKQPSLPYIDGQNIYILNFDNHTISIYSRNELRLKVTFGGKGEGPGEFRIIQGFGVYDDFVFVNSPGKNSYFSKKGELLKEVKCPPHLIPCLPVGDHFVSREYSTPSAKASSDPYTEIKIVLLGPDFEKSKTLFKKKINSSYVYNPKTGEQEAWLFPDYCFFRVYKDKIYIGYSSTKGFFFSVFDSDGDKLYEIKRPYEKREIPVELKNVIQKRLQRTPVSNRIMKIRFYDHFPSFSNFTVADDKIYVFLYPTINMQQIFIMDLRGKLIGVNSIPFDLKILEESSFRILFSNIKIHDGWKYFLSDNFETNIWELWRIKVFEIKK